MAYVQLIGTFTNPDATPVAGGTLQLWLSQDATISGTAQIVSLSKTNPLSVTLDSNGSIPTSPPFKVWGVDSLSPSGLVYYAQVLNSQGTPVATGYTWSISGASPVDVTTLVQSSSGASYPGAVLLNPAGDQSITAFDLLPANGNTSQSLGTSAAPWQQSYINLKQANGVVYADAFPGATADAQINNAIAALPSSGGLVDARGLVGNQTIASTITLGSNTGPVSLLLGARSFFTVTIASATPVFQMYSFSSIVGVPEGNNQSLIELSSSSHVSEVIKVVPLSSPVDAGNISIQNVSIIGAAGAVIDNAMVHLPAVFDSNLYGVTIGSGGATNCKLLWIHDGPSSGITNSVYLYGLQIDGAHASGCVPVTIETDSLNGTTAVHFFGADIGHPGSGQHAILISGHNTTTLSNIDFNGVYVESNSTDTSTSIVSIVDARQVNFNGFFVNRLSASSAATGIAISETTTGNTDLIGARNYRIAGGNGSGNAITNSAAGGYTVSSGFVNQYDFISTSNGGTAVVGPMVTSATTISVGPGASRGSIGIGSSIAEFFAAANALAQIGIEQAGTAKWRIGIPASSNKLKLSQTENLSDNLFVLDISGNQTLGGKLTGYNGLTTAGNGVPSEANQIAVTAQAANYNSGSAQTIFTPTAASQLRINYSQAITQAATSSSTFPSLTLSWTDVGGIARTKALVATSTTNTTAVESDGAVVITTNTNTPVQITSANYASSGATAMQYALSVTTEIL